MTRLTAKDIRKLNPMERKKKLEQLYNELSNTRVQMVTGGSTENPYKIRTIKRTIARIKTIEREQEAQGL